MQRYLSAKNVDEARSAHLISAYWKIPLQSLVLLVGLLVFVYYLFLAPPLYFNPAQEQLVKRADPAAYQLLDGRYHALFDARAAAAHELAAAPAGADATQRATLKERDAAVAQVHGEALDLAAKISGTASKDVNYIIPHFVLTELPIGLTGLFIAAVIVAAMSAVAGELSALATATVIDHYRRWVRPDADDARLLLVSRAATGAWGLFACIVATFAASLGSLIEVVNRFGSIFYGSILGVFILAMLPRIRANAAFVTLIAGMSAVGSVIVFAPQVSFLWHNVVGAVTVVMVGTVLSVARHEESLEAAQIEPLPRNEDPYGHGDILEQTQTNSRACPSMPKNYSGIDRRDFLFISARRGGCERARRTRCTQSTRPWCRRRRSRRATGPAADHPARRADLVVVPGLSRRVNRSDSGEKLQQRTRRTSIPNAGEHAVEKWNGPVPSDDDDIAFPSRTPAVRASQSAQDYVGAADGHPYLGPSSQRAQPAMLLCAVTILESAGAGEEAARADAEISPRAWHRGPLHGIPCTA